jgi:hypothetical protein
VTTASGSRGLLRRFALVVVVLLFGPFQTGSRNQGRAAPQISAASRHDSSAELRHMPALPPRAALPVAKPPRRLPNRLGDAGAPGDGALQQSAPSPSQPVVAAASRA